MINTLSDLLDAAHIFLPEHAKQQLVSYIEMLSKWNRAYNLTAVRDPRQMLIRHILDSIVAEPHLQGSRFIDVGSGPGLPGIPLAIVRPGARFTLLDSLGKRIRFLRQVQHELKLTNIELVQSRVENYIASPLYDGVISRAFASLKDMLNGCQQLPKEDGAFYAFKGGYPDKELAELPAGYCVGKITGLTVPELAGERHLIIIKRLYC